jgi:pyrimidine-nucleoside phosphorylase
MNFLSLIEAKRDGESLDDDQIRQAVRLFARGEIPDYQMAAFLMAVYFQGLSKAEERTLTLAMRDSGEVLRLDRSGDGEGERRAVVDKHSTGGVGDKVSLPLAPLLAALGFRVPMISGRGLGITGGTLDKMDSIPGYRSMLTRREVTEIVDRTGCVICGQSDEMVPADKALYELRDVTGTVPSIPLITASILSKKLAEDLDALVLDVKFGSAAFMKTRDQAHALARSIVDLGAELDLPVRALLTDMDVPLGRAAGNWLEVREAVGCLRGRQGEGPEDVAELVIECAAHLMEETGRVDSRGAPLALERARAEAREALASGAVLGCWEAMLEAQGADMDAYHARLEEESIAPVVHEVRAADTGFVTGCDARIVGEVVRDLGGGRLRKDTEIDPAVGVDRLAKPGDRLERGGLMARIHARTREEAEAEEAHLREAITLSDRPMDERESLIAEVVGAG